MRYRLNDADVVSEVLDGEVIAIHLHTGTYYSMLESAAAIWNALLGGWTASEVTDHWVQILGLERARVEADVAEFIAALMVDDLILPMASATGERQAGVPLPAAYTTPKLQKYTDMQELLLVDPIHEVTEAGWPNRSDKAG